MTNPAHERPLLTDELSGAEFLRWYWLKDELAGFARSLGISAAGGKHVLSERIAAALDGRTFPEPAPGRPAGRQLSGPLTHATVIPAGQRCSQAVRGWLSGQIGSAFHFDAAMRAFFAGADGTQTLADALEHWHGTRKAGPQGIGAQFEYNRFTRSWHRDHPDGTRDQLQEAWSVYRSSPVDARGRA